MRIGEAVEAVKDFCDTNAALFSGVNVQLAFGEEGCGIGDWSDHERPGMLITGDGVGDKSGVYFFSSCSGEILYIGKATKDNLHHRVWDHVKTPEVKSDGWRTFPKHGLRCAAEDGDYEVEVLNGHVRLGVLVISDPDLVSLVEVYLHTLHIKSHNRLPVFNKQIG